MPIYLRNYNLIIKKSSVSENYRGGMAQFRKDYEIGTSEVNQEDDELFAIGFMNIADSDIDQIIEKGLHYDEARKQSDEFCILYRYASEPSWETPWLKHNNVFAWHSNTHADNIKKAEAISRMSMDEIIKHSEEGNDPFGVIRYIQI